VDDLVMWLRAQIAEGRAAALACAGAPWSDYVPGMVHVDPAAIRENKQALGRFGYVAGTDNSPGGDVYRRHIVRHDPRAALALCDAHTAILDQWKGLAQAPPEMSGIDAIRVEMEYVLRALTLAYQHRDGFREEWR
jgi:hypothetical protein